MILNFFFHPAGWSSGRNAVPALGKSSSTCSKCAIIRELIRNAQKSEWSVYFEPRGFEWLRRARAKWESDLEFYSSHFGEFPLRLKLLDKRLSTGFRNKRENRTLTCWEVQTRLFSANWYHGRGQANSFETKIGASFRLILCLMHIKPCSSSYFLHFVPCSS